MKGSVGEKDGRKRFKISYHLGGRVTRGKKKSKVPCTLRVTMVD